MGRVVGGGWRGLNASERCLIFRHHLFLVFCELEASFVSNTSHTLRAARHQQQGLHHLFQTTAQCDPLHPLTTNHTMFDDVVNPLLERFLPSGSFTKSSKPAPEPQLICTVMEDDNENKEGGRDRTWRPKAGVSPPPPRPRRTEIEGRQRCTNKAMLLHFNQLLPSHMAAEHPEGRRRHES